jgi:hypothetical protein
LKYYLREPWVLDGDGGDDERRPSDPGALGASEAWKQRVPCQRPNLGVTTLLYTPTQAKCPATNILSLRLITY